MTMAQMKQSEGVAPGVSMSHVIVQFGSGFTAKELAAKLGCSPKYVSAVRSRHGIRGARLAAKSALVQQIETLLAAGVRVVAIAAELDCDPSYVSSVKAAWIDAKRAEDAAAAAQAEEPPHPLLQSGGRYREIAAYAAQHGMSNVAALQQYHRLRAAARGAR